MKHRMEKNGSSVGPKKVLCCLFLARCAQVPGAAGGSASAASPPLQREGVCAANAGAGAALAVLL